MIETPRLTTTSCVQGHRNAEEQSTVPGSPPWHVLQYNENVCSYVRRVDDLSCALTHHSTGRFVPHTVSSCPALGTELGIMEHNLVRGSLGFLCVNGVSCSLGEGGFTQRDIACQSCFNRVTYFFLGRGQGSRASVADVNVFWCFVP